MSSVSRAIVFQKHLDVTNELDGEFFLRALVSGKELIHRCFRQGDRFVLVVVEVGIMIVSRMDISFTDPFLGFFFDIPGIPNDRWGKKGRRVMAVPTKARDRL